MAYRDDLGAARIRVESLQKQLDGARGGMRARDKEIEVLSRELSQLREKLSASDNDKRGEGTERIEQELAEMRKRVEGLESDAKPPFGPWTVPVAMVVSLGLCGVILVVLFYPLKSSRTPVVQSYSPPPVTTILCKLRSTPEGATVQVGSLTIGKTPIDYALEYRSDKEVFTFKKEGFLVDLQIKEVDPMRECQVFSTLEPEPQVRPQFQRPD